MLQHMANRKSSGLTVSAYCKEAGIGEALYYYWQKKLNTWENKGSFHQIAVSENIVPVRLCYPNGVSIELGTTDIAVIKQLICCI
jgi:hypothetical protein